MMFLRISLIAVVLYAQSVCEGRSDLQSQVAIQVNRIRSISGESENRFFELPGVTSFRDDSPVQELIKLGMDSIPYLIPYLSDTSFTQAYRVHGNGTRRPARVNEYILIAINRIADHNFTFALELDDTTSSVGRDPNVPRKLEGLQSEINSWWEQNRSRDLLERKIRDLNDPFHDNRFSAYRWLGRTKAKEGRVPLEQKIEALLIGQVDSLKQSEMAAVAEALAEIGDVVSAPVVRKVCDQLSYWLYMSYRPIEEGRSATWSGQISTLFEAYHALAILGFKDEAVSNLRELRRQYLKQMEAHTREEFLRNLKTTLKWQ